MAVDEEINDPEEKTEGRRYSSFISFGNAMVIFAKKLSLLLHFYFDTVPLFLKLMLSPSAISKFVLSTLKFFKHTQFLKYTQNVFGTLKSEILLHKLDNLSILKTF